MLEPRILFRFDFQPAGAQKLKNSCPVKHVCLNRKCPIIVDFQVWHCQSSRISYGLLQVRGSDGFCNLEIRMRRVHRFGLRFVQACTFFERAWCCQGWCLICATFGHSVFLYIVRTKRSLVPAPEKGLVMSAAFLAFTGP